MIDQEISIVEQLRDNINEFITEKGISIKFQLLAESTRGRLSIEYDFGSGADGAVIDEIIRRLRAEDLIVEYISTASADSKSYRISWDHPGLT